MRYFIFLIPLITILPSPTNWEKNNTLPFLETLIYQTEKNNNISVYRKSTNTGLHIHWNCYVPIQAFNLSKT